MKNCVSHVAIYPASHYIVPPEKMKEAIEDIRGEMEERVKYLPRTGQAHRGPAHRSSAPTTTLRCFRRSASARASRTIPGCCHGRPAGSTPYTLLDYFPEDFLLVRGRIPCDAAPGAGHVRRGPVPQGDAWWTTASACPRRLDNRPLNFEEFYSKLNQVVYVSATPAAYLSGSTAPRSWSR